MCNKGKMLIYQNTYGYLVSSKLSLSVSHILESFEQLYVPENRRGPDLHEIRKRKENSQQTDKHLSNTYTNTTLHINIATYIYMYK